MNSLFITDNHLNDNIKLINISPMCNLEKPCSHVCECQLTSGEHVITQLPMNIIITRINEINPDMLEHFAQYSDDIKKIISDKSDYKKRSIGHEWRTNAGEIILKINPECIYGHLWHYPCSHECLCKYPNDEQSKKIIDCQVLSLLLQTNKLDIDIPSNLREHIIVCSNLRNKKN